MNNEQQCGEAFAAWWNRPNRPDAVVCFREHDRAAWEAVWQAAWSAAQAQQPVGLTDEQIAKMLVAVENDPTIPKLDDDGIMSLCAERGWSTNDTPSLRELAHVFFAEGAMAQRKALQQAAQPAQQPVGRLQLMEDKYGTHPEPLYEIVVLNRRLVHDDMLLYAAPVDAQQERDSRVAQLGAALRSVNAVAIERGDKYGACDQIDNDGQPYQSEWFAKLLQAQGERTTEKGGA